MLLRKAEVQYVAEMPLDNRTVNKFAASPPLLALFRPFETPLRPKRPNVSLQPEVL
jgi:hypothetical protein